MVRLDSDYPHGSHLRSSRIGTVRVRAGCRHSRLRVNSGMSSSSVVESLSRRKAVSQQDLNASLPEGPFDMAPRATDRFRVAERSARCWGFDPVSYENSTSLTITGLWRNRRR